MNRLKTKYTDEVSGKLKEELGIDNPMAVPKLNKVVLNMGIGEAKDNSGLMDKAIVALAAITGQKPIITKAKKSIAAFKLTQGAPIGLMVTLRGVKMYSFLDKLINVVLPKVRDFRGVPDRSFDGMGNYNLGLREQTLFPEVDYKSVDKVRGLQITINTTAQSKAQGRRLLELLGMPFQKGSNV